MDYITRIMPLDKFYHLVAGFLVGLLGSLLLNPALGVTLALVAGGAKEWVWDLGHNWYLARKGLPPAHDVDTQDFYFTAAGGGIAAVGITLVMLALAAFKGNLA